MDDLESRLQQAFEMARRPACRQDRIVSWEIREGVAVGLDRSGHERCMMSLKCFKKLLEDSDTHTGA